MMADDARGAAAAVPPKLAVLLPALMCPGKAVIDTARAATSAARVLRELMALPGRREVLLASAGEWAPPLWRLLTARGTPAGGDDDGAGGGEGATAAWGAVRACAASCCAVMVAEVAGQDAITASLARGE
ncbi:hypothetical protein FOA52_008603 [Chlamydomonas sp. UWO 241]|nr:hypothetical protein FOA52_008603 [Chlamydomonas sp. UWO 241]